MNDLVYLSPNTEDPFTTSEVKDACFTNGFTKIAGKNIRKYEKI